MGFSPSEKTQVIKKVNQNHASIVDLEDKVLSLQKSIDDLASKLDTILKKMAVSK